MRYYIKRSRFRKLSQAGYRYNRGIFVKHTDEHSFTVDEKTGEHKTYVEENATSTMVFMGKEIEVKGMMMKEIDRKPDLPEGWYETR